MQNGITNGASSPPAVDRAPVRRSTAFKAKFLAIAVVCVMIVSALAMILPALVVSPNDNVPANTTANNGEREVYWNYSDFFHMKFQDWNWNHTSEAGVTFETAGHHESNPTNKYPDRMPTWYLLREPGYGEYVYRATYPHIFYYNPYSTITTPDVSVGWLMYAPMRETMWARNVTECNTTTDAYFVPDLDGNPARPNGGTIDASFYLTYLSTPELAVLKSNGYGAHYAAWLYGLPGKLAGMNDDGYWAALMGKITYSREAAMGYLGWDGTGDVRTFFTTNEADLESFWFDDWAMEGGTGGAFDVYTAYDYSEDLRVCVLQIDNPNSTANTLTIRVYTISWGMDAQIVRYLEAANLTKKIGQGWFEDMNLHLNIGPSMTNATMSTVVNYILTSWADEDGSVWSGGWKIETQHMDWAGNTAIHNTYISPYNAYDPDQTDWTTRSLSPWTSHFNGSVSYWVTPFECDLETYENIIIQAPTTDVLGIRPGYAATETPAAYLANIQANDYWGRMVLGQASWPYAAISNAYDPITKRIWLKGAQDFPTETIPGQPTLLQQGVPSFQFDVSPVSTYQVQVTGPHQTTLQDTITVTARNGTGALTSTGTPWYNGTVTLTDTDGGANPASTSHTWAAGDNSVWTTTITWATAGNQYINATDSWYNLDVTGTSGAVPVSLIPEFSTLLIPTIGAIAIFLVFRTKRRRKTE